MQIGEVLVSPDIITEHFCCDLDACHGQCCVDGDAGAPVTLDEVALLEDSLDTVWPALTAQAQAVIDRQGVVYADRDGDLVTSIVQGRECVFATRQGKTCLCTIDRACREGRTQWPKPISCALYPIREKVFSNGLVGINYHRWDICEGGRKKGRALSLPLYRFLREPLVRRFGQEWYDELCQVAEQVEQLLAEG